MTFDTLERSNYLGTPIALFEFNIGTRWWRYCSADADVVVGGNSYKAVAVSDTGVVQSGDAKNDDLTITMPSTEEIGTFFVATPPSDETWVTLRRMHEGDSEAPIIWVGTVNAAKLSGLRTIQFSCRTLTASFDRNGLRLTYGRQCHHALYDRNCRVDKEQYAIVSQITALDGNSFVTTNLAALAAGYLDNGFVEVIVNGLLNRKPIETQTPQRITLLGTSDGLGVGAFVRLFPGCNRTVSHCTSKFNNLSNYGGFPNLPGKSPFDGDPVF